MLLSELVEERSDGIFVNLNTLISPEQFSKWLDNIFQNGYFFNEPKYGVINQILYNFEKVPQLTKVLKGSGKAPELKIASGKEKITEERLEIYHDPKISRDNTFAEYFFGKVHITKTENEITQEIETILHPDEFYAQMWAKWIRYGINMENIDAIIKDGATGQLTIAEWKDPEEWTDAHMKQMRSFEEKKGIKESAGARVDLRVYQESCVQVVKDELLFKKIPRVDGKPWWSVRGERRDPEKPEDIDIKTFLWEGTYLKIEEGVEYIAAINKGYPHEDKWIISIDTTYTFKTGINVTSGDTHVVEDAIIENNVGVGYKIIGDKSLIFKGNIEGTVIAEENIEIDGNIVGKRKWWLVDNRNIRGSDITDGRVTSNSENISIKWRIENGYLKAKNGTITVKNANNSFIIGDTVIITGDCFNCTIIANSIIIQGEAQSCRVLAKKSIEAKEVTTWRAEIENTYTMAIPDAKRYLEQDKTLIEHNTTLIKTKHKTVDTLMGEFPWEDITKKELLFNLLKKCDDDKNFFAQQSDKLKMVFRKYHISIKEIKKLQKAIDELKEENLLLLESIKQNEEKFEKDLIEMFIKINAIQGYTCVQHLTYYLPEDIFDINIDNLEVLVRTTSGDHITNIFRDDDGSVDWRYENNI